MNHGIEVCINRAISVAVEHRNILYLYIISLRFRRKAKQGEEANTYKDYKKEAEKVFDIVVHDYTIARF
jgi:hypothetical protein